MSRRAALYARTSTTEQEPETQLIALRDYARRREWPVELEYVDDGFSGTTAHRPALDAMMRDARRGRFDVVIAWRLDRVGRSLRHLNHVMDDLRDAGVLFASVSDAIDLSTAAGVFQMQLIAAYAQFEQTIIVERVRAGLERARRDGTRIGRPPKRGRTVAELQSVATLSCKLAAEHLNRERPGLDVSPSTISRWRRFRCD